MKHELWIDRWKGVLILLVVIGHAVGTGSTISSGHTAQWLNDARMVIYSFHMPAFFILSGFCYKMFNNEGTIVSWSNFLRNRAFRLLLPYFIFGVFSVVIFALVHGYANWWQPIVSLLHAGSWPNGEGFRCNSVLWFLPCMFSVLCFAKVVSSVLGKVLKNAAFTLRMIMLLFLMLVMFGLYHWENWGIHLHFLPYGVDMIPWYFGYFACGVLIKEVVTKYRGRVISIKLNGSIFTGLSLTLLAAHWYIAHDNYHHSLDPHFGGGYYSRVALTVIATMITALVAIAIRWRWLESVGLASMGIMLIHKFPLVFIQEKVFTKIPWLTPQTSSLKIALVSALLVAAFSMVTAYFATLILRHYAPWMIGERRKNG